MSVAGALTDINNAILDLQAADYNTYARPLKQLAAALQDSSLKPLNDELKAGVDFDLFLSSSESDGGMAGSDTLDWPLEKAKVLGLTLVLIERAAVDPNWFLNFAHHFYYAGSNHIAAIRKVVSSAIIPFGRDYRAFVEGQPPAPEPESSRQPAPMVSGRMASLDPETSRKLVPIGRFMGEHFTAGNWTELGFLTGLDGLVQSHPRLLRSLSFGDPDYPECCLAVVGTMVRSDPSNLKIVEDYIAEHFGEGGPNISTIPGLGQAIRFTPTVFKVPAEPQDAKLVAVMMPFGPAFGGVYDAIKSACQQTNWFYAQRADDIWKDSTVIQDVFSLIFRSQIVVCDYTGRNPNVFYEAGIAHTLGKTVIPITQNSGDVPSDVVHHRYLQYLNNGEGLASLSTGLSQRLRNLGPALASSADWT